MKAKRFSRVVVSLAGLLLVASVVSLAFVFALSRGLARDALRAAAEAEASRQLGVPVRIGALEGPLLPDFTLVDLSIGPEGSSLISAERVMLRVDLWTLTSVSAWTIDSLSIDGLNIEMIQSSNGEWQTTLAGGSNDSPTSELPLVRIRKLALRGNRLKLRREDGERIVVRFALDANDVHIPFTAARAREVSAELAMFLDPEESDRLHTQRVELDATLLAGRVSAKGVVADEKSGTVEFEGSTEISDWLDVAQPAFAVIEAHISGLDLAALGGSPRVSGRLAGSARLQIRLDAGAPPADAEATLEIVVADSSTAAVESASLIASWARQRWNLSRLDVTGSGVQLSAQGAGGRDAIDSLRVAARVGDLGTLVGFAAPPGAEGELAIDLDISGPLSEPQGRVSLRGEQLALPDLEIGSLRAELSGSGDGRVRVESFELSGGAIPMHLLEPADIQVRDGVLTLERFSIASDAIARNSMASNAVASDQQAIEIGGVLGNGFVRDLRIKLRGFEVGAFAALVGSPIALAGVADVQLRLDGALPFPGVDGQIEWTQPGIGSFVFEHLSADFGSVKKRLRIRSQIREAGRELARVEGWVPYDGSRLEPGEWLGSPQTSLLLRVDSLDLAHIGSAYPNSFEALSGRIGLELDLVGGEVPSATGRVELVDGSARFAGLETSFSPVQGTARFEPDAKGIRVSSFELDVSGQKVSGQGVIGARELHDVELTARQLDISLAAPFLPAASEWKGAVDLDIALSGAIAQPRIEASAVWRAPEIAGQPLERVDGKLEFDGRMARMDLRIHDGGREIFNAQAAAPFAVAVAEPEDWLNAPDTRLDLRAVDVPLAWVQPFVSRPLRELSGRVNASAEIRGGVEPVVSGVVELADGRVVVPLLRQTFAPIHARIVLGAETLTIEDFRVGTAEAGATLRGSIELAHLVPDRVELYLALNDLPVARSPALKADVAGEVQVGGSVSNLQVRGQLELRKLAVVLGEAADSSIREIRILTAQGNSPGGSGVREASLRPPSWYERAALDVRLHLPRNSWLRGRGSELDLTGDLELRKEALQSATIAGRAEVVRGTYVFQTKRFDVRRGFVTFDGGTELDPLLDVEAAHRVRDVNVLVFLYGRASAPLVRIGSEPTLSESDALAYLFLGRPANQVGAGQKAGMDSAAAALATGVAAAQVTDLLAASLPIDTLDMAIDETGKPAEIKVGKYITDRVFVRYGRTLGPEPEDQVRVEMRINPNWSVGTDVSTSENAGADVIWSLDY